jgi:hypothetical protein
MYFLRRLLIQHDPFSVYIIKQIVKIYVSETVLVLTKAAAFIFGMFTVKKSKNMLIGFAMSVHMSTQKVLNISS